MDKKVEMVETTRKFDWTNKLTISNLVIVLLLIISVINFWLYTREKSRNSQLIWLKQAYEKQIQQYAKNYVTYPQKVTYPTPKTMAGELETGTIKLDKINVNWADKLVEYEDHCSEGAQCFLVGKITNKEIVYSGKNFYLEVSPTMGGSEMRHFAIETDANGQEIKAYTRDTQGNVPAAVITGIDDIPNEINFPSSAYKLKKAYSPSYLFTELKVGNNKVFTNPVIGDFYLTDADCLVARLPDGTAIAYNFVIPFIGNEGRQVNLTFSNGQVNKEDYDYIRRSCGGACTYLLTVPTADLKPDTRLEIAGTTSNGEKVYQIKNPQDKQLLDLYNDKNTIAYYGNDSAGSGDKSKYTYEEFLSYHPYLFWKNPLGEWVEFQNTKFATAAEMCKPVVYLYPQKETQLNLTLSLHGILTKTIPAYNQGWQVLAFPDGKIKNISDNNYYNYLLWEGIGVSYPEIDQGWVVKRENLDSFLSDKLKVLGLNEKEMADFKEYWLIRLNEKPFYRISFLTKNQFEDLAKIKFSPTQPDVFIRVMMTAKGLDKDEQIEEQKMPNRSPARYGFTAVEWGGALLK